MTHRLIWGGILSLLLPTTFLLSQTFGGGALNFSLGLEADAGLNYTLQREHVIQDVERDAFRGQPGYQIGFGLNIAPRRPVSLTIGVHWLRDRGEIENFRYEQEGQVLLPNGNVEPVTVLSRRGTVRLSEWSTRIDIFLRIQVQPSIALLAGIGTISHLSGGMDYDFTETVTHLLDPQTGLYIPLAEPRISEESSPLPISDNYGSWLLGAEYQLPGQHIFARLLWNPSWNRGSGFDLTDQESDRLGLTIGYRL